MQTAVVFSSRTKVQRRVITGENIDNSHCGPGEEMLFLGPDDAADHHSINEKIAAHANIDVEEIPTGRCVVVDNETGRVVAVIMADSELDSHPAGYLVEDDFADIGWCNTDLGLKAT